MPSYPRVDAVATTLGPASAEWVSDGRPTLRQNRDRADHGDGMAAVAAAQPAGEEHRDDGSGGDPEQGEPERAGGGAGLLPDGGNAHDPAGEDEAVEGEEEGQGEAEADEVGAWHGTVRAEFVY